MNLKKSLCVPTVALVFTIVVGAQAKAKDSKSVLVPYDATIAGSHLASGSYNVQWQTHSPEATVTFAKSRKVLVTAEGKVVDRGTAYPSNGIVYTRAADGARVIKELRFRGSSEVIIFNQ